MATPGMRDPLPSEVVQQGRIIIDNERHMAKMSVVWKGRQMDLAVPIDENRSFNKILKDLENNLIQQVSGPMEGKPVEKRQEFRPGLQGKARKQAGAIEDAAKRMHPPLPVRKQEIQALKQKISDASRGKIDPEQAFEELKGQDIGSFIIRDSRNQEGIKEICFINPAGQFDRISVEATAKGIEIFAPKTLEKKI